MGFACGGLRCYHILSPFTNEQIYCCHFFKAPLHEQLSTPYQKGINTAILLQELRVFHRFD